MNETMKILEEERIVFEKKNFRSNMILFILMFLLCTSIMGYAGYSIGEANPKMKESVDPILFFGGCGMVFALFGLSIFNCKNIKYCSLNMDVDLYKSLPFLYPKEQKRMLKEDFRKYIDTIYERMMYEDLKRNTRLHDSSMESEVYKLKKTEIQNNYANKTVKVNAKNLFKKRYKIG